MKQKKTRCPKDADTIGKDYCLEQNGTLICTRDYGHKGEHHAHGLHGRCLAVWK